MCEPIEEELVYVKEVNFATGAVTRSMLVAYSQAMDFILQVRAVRRKGSPVIMCIMHLDRLPRREHVFAKGMMDAASIQDK